MKFNTYKEIKKLVDEYGVYKLLGMEGCCCGDLYIFKEMISQMVERSLNKV